MAIISKSKRFIKSPSCQKVRHDSCNNRFLSSVPDLTDPSWQVINGIWTGRVIYQAASVHAIIADVRRQRQDPLFVSLAHSAFMLSALQNYKTKPIGLYNPHKAPLLDHYRLRVPRVRAVLELTKSVAVASSPIFMPSRGTRY
jgi:hypothetical protein